MLIGQPPAAFSLKAIPFHARVPNIPLQAPSTLLERRPDVAQAERLMAQANAEIGIAVGAFFPTATLSASGGYESSSFKRWFTLPSRLWAVGPQLAATLFNGGLLSSKAEAARANYDASVASYRQTVLSAFQDVEDNLASVNRLEKEMSIQNDAVKGMQRAFELVRDQHEVGTVAMTDIVNAQLAVYNAEKSAITVKGRQLTAVITLIKALGGGW